MWRPQRAFLQEDDYQTFRCLPMPYRARRSRNRDLLGGPERGLHRRLIEAWQQALTTLTYIRHSGQGVLVDDETAFWQAFA
jgi:hypothetical protein